MKKFINILLLTFLMLSVSACLIIYPTRNYSKGIYAIGCLPNAANVERGEIVTNKEVTHFTRPERNLRKLADKWRVLTIHDEPGRCSKYSNTTRVELFAVN